MTQAVVALFDDRPFFEKAVAFGVQHGVLDQAKLDAIQTDAPKGMVQIARYFGSEFLRPELEKAKDRIVNLVSLTLEIQSGGDLRKAAEQLREHSFMSRSKAASDMLKALIVMPQNTHFGMNEHGGFSDKHIPQLAKWSLCNLADYQAELAKRQQVAHVIDAAIWMADQLGLHADDLEEAGCDAEAVIRTALLAAATALFIMATAVSEPAGAFLAALSIRSANFFWASAVWPSMALPNSAPITCSSRQTPFARATPSKSCTNRRSPRTSAAPASTS